MADILDGLVEHLKANAAVAALIATNGQARIYPLTLPQNPVFPALTYQLVSTLESEDHEGPAGLDEIIVQVNAWGRTQHGRADGFASAKAVSRAVRDAVVGFAGRMGTVKVHHVAVAGPRDDHEPELSVFSRSIDLTIWHES